MGYVTIVFGTLIAFNFGVGYLVSEDLYEDEMKKQFAPVVQVSSSENDN